MSKSQNKISHEMKIVQQISLFIAIIIAINIFFHAGLSAFYPQPEYETTCPKVEITEDITNQAACEENNGEWIGGLNDIKDTRYRPIPYDKPEFEPYCDLYAECQELYDNQRLVYQRNVFIILTVLGFAVFALGFAIRRSVSVSAGLHFGGIVSMLIGTIGYWSDMGEILRFVIAGAILLILILFGYKKLKD